MRKFEGHGKPIRKSLAPSLLQVRFRFRLTSTADMIKKPFVTQTTTLSRPRVADIVRFIDDRRRILKQCIYTLLNK